MAASIKWISGIIILALAAGVAWYLGLFSSFFMAPRASIEQQATTTSQQAAAEPVHDLPTGRSDTSDNAIARDSAAVDLQIKALNDDSDGIDQSLNDTPVSQEY